MSVLKIRNTPNGAWQPIASIKGAKGDKGDTGGNVTDAVKLALLRIANNVWYDEDGKSAAYVKALQDALFPPANLVSISAVYTQSDPVYTTAELDDLKDDLVVTATLTGGTTKTIAAADYFLDGELKAGTRTITVSYGGQTTTFDVVVTWEPNGFVDGTYSVEGTEIELQDNRISFVSYDTYRHIQIPLQKPIDLKTGDIVTISSKDFDLGTSGAGSGTSIAIAINNGDYYAAEWTGYLKPYRANPEARRYTASSPLKLSTLKVQPNNINVGSAFTFVLKINGEVVF